MSRRTSRIQRITTSTSTTAPTIEKIQPIVVPITIRVIAIAVTSGRIVGPGRWISSPAGGAGCAE